MTKYNAVLDLHKGFDGLREWMQKCFLVGDFAVATDGHCLAIVDKSLTEGLEESDYKNKDRVVSLLTDMPHNVNNIIHKAQLLEAIGCAPLVDEMKESGRDIECEECKGEGCVEWNYKHYEEEHECPICKGDGMTERSRLIPTGRKVADNNATIKIDFSHFRIELIKKLLSTTDILNEDKVTLLSMTDKHKGSLFQIGEAKIVLMPMGNMDSVEPVYSIKTS